MNPRATLALARTAFFRASPTPRLAGAIAVLAPLWFIPSVGGWLVLAGAVALAALLAAEWVLLPAPRDIELEREMAPAVGISDQSTGAYHLTSRYKRTLALQLYDEMPAGVAREALPDTVSLAPFGSESVPLTVTGKVRGRHALGRVAVVARTPIGLLAARLRYEPGDAILVTPSVSGVRRFRLLALHQRLHVAGVRMLRQRGEGTNLAGLREYVVGDDPRHIDWKASARRNTTIVREHRVEQSQVVITMIDAGRSMTQLAGEFSRLEHALSAALVLTDVAAQGGDRVGTLVFDDQVRAYSPPQRGQAALRSVRDALVPVNATMVEPDYAAAFRFLATKQRRRALIVFFTDVMDVRSSRALFAYVARSAARHLVVVVALRNDTLFESAGALHPRADALYESAAAEELIQARAETLERMRRSGVAVLDVSPQSMTATIVNRYLELKSRGLL
ncbi:MAG: hypothetical protein JWO05_3022 [Gemmatimonadetes bacterium]|nr:hypothetical protein [Gemmatimonadota bacterium]